MPKKPETDDKIRRIKYQLDLNRVLFAYLGRSLFPTRKQIQDCQKEIEIEMAYLRRLCPDDSTRDTQQH